MPVCLQRKDPRLALEARDPRAEQLPYTGPSYCGRFLLPMQITQTYLFCQRGPD